VAASDTGVHFAATLRHLAGIRRFEQRHVLRIERGERVQVPLLHPAVEVPGADPVGERERRVLRRQDRDGRLLVGHARVAHHLRRVGRKIPRDVLLLLILDDERSAALHELPEARLIRDEGRSCLRGTNADDDGIEGGQVAIGERRIVEQRDRYVHTAEGVRDLIAAAHDVADAHGGHGEIDDLRRRHSTRVDAVRLDVRIRNHLQVMGVGRVANPGLQGDVVAAGWATGRRRDLERGRHPFDVRGQ